MAIDYERIKTQTAERLLRENGKTGTIVRQVPSSSPDIPPWEVDSIVEDDYQVIFLSTDWTQNLRSAETVEKWDIIGIISTETGVTPEQNDRFIMDGTQYHITEVRPLAPGPVTMLYYITGIK